MEEARRKRTRFGNVGGGGGGFGGGGAGFGAEYAEGRAGGGGGPGEVDEKVDGVLISLSFSNFFSALPPRRSFHSRSTRTAP